MPCLQTTVNSAIPKDIEQKIAKKYGKAISLLPGKSEQSLMLQFTDNAHLYFKGECDLPIAFVEVKLFGQSTKEAYNRLTAEICQILQDELQIPQANIYVKYEEGFHWGCNGKNI